MKALVILAAGLGSRYGSFKQLKGVGPNEEWLMEYSIFDAFKAGFDQVICLINPSLEPFFKQRLLPRWNRHKERVFLACQSLHDLPSGFECLLERVKPWGTAHCLWCLRDKLKVPFMLINADDYYGPAAFETIAHFLNTPSPDLLQAMVTYPLAQTLSAYGSTSRGVCTVDVEQYLVAIQEYTQIAWSPANEDGSLRLPAATEGGRRTIAARALDGQVTTLPEDTPVSMNCWGLKPAIFVHLEQQFRAFLQQHSNNLQAEFYLPAFIMALLQSQCVKVKTYRSLDKWFGMTYAKDTESVKMYLKESREPLPNPQNGLE